MALGQQPTCPSQTGQGWLMELQLEAPNYVMDNFPLMRRITPSGSQGTIRASIEYGASTCKAYAPIPTTSPAKVMPSKVQ